MHTLSRRWTLLLLLGMGLALLPALPARASVDLSDFYAESEGEAIILYWETATELDNLGFHLWRSENAVLDDASRITASLIPSKVAGQPIGAEYDFTDGNVQPGIVYHYWLEDIDINGASQFHGPVQASLDGSGSGVTAVPGGDQTPTPVPTSTPAPTQTAGPSSTPQPSQTPRPAPSSTPPPPSATPQATVVATATPPAEAKQAGATPTDEGLEQGAAATETPASVQLPAPAPLEEQLPTETAAAPAAQAVPGTVQPTPEATTPVQVIGANSGQPAPIPTSVTTSASQEGSRGRLPAVWLLVVVALLFLAGGATIYYALVRQQQPTP